MKNLDQLLDVNEQKEPEVERSPDAPSCFMKNINTNTTLITFCCLSTFIKVSENTELFFTPVKYSGGRGGGVDTTV